MIISVPRERKTGESRVALTPIGAESLISSGHTVVIERQAGVGSGYPDEAYRAVGARIANSLEEVWTSAQLLVKVKEPHAEEIPFFRKDLSLFCFLHPAAEKEITEALIAHSVAAFDYDLLSTEDGRLPILEPMSIIAGKLSIQCGASVLESINGGRGVLLGGAPGAKPARVLVIGCGAAGSAAGAVAAGMGAEVVFVDIDVNKVQRFIASSGIQASAVVSSPESIKAELPLADLVIGAVLVPGDLAPKLINKEHLKTMKAGAALVDICIDQGGFAETSRAMSLIDPTYVKEGVVHYCVPNMPALVPRTSTKALTHVTLPWLHKLAQMGVEGAIAQSSELRSSLVCLRGELTNATVGAALGIPSHDPLAPEENQKEEI